MDSLPSPCRASSGRCRASSPAPPQASCQACPVRRLLEAQAEGHLAPLVWVSQLQDLTNPRAPCSQQAL